jgi:two-component system, cell cycle sensor histidine kinase and response regulator CckA
MTQDKPQSSEPASADAASLSFSSSTPSLEGARGSSTFPTSDSSAYLSEKDFHKELRRLKRALHALSGCNRALAQATSEKELLQQICDVIVQVGEYRLAWIGYAQSDEAKTVKPMAHAGDEAGYLDEIVVTWSESESGRGPMGTAIRKNEVCVIADPESDANFAPWRSRARQRGYAALIAVPLRVAGSSFGAIGIYSGQKGSFENSEVELLTEIANNLAYGITAIHSHDEGKRATAALLEAESKYRQLVEQVPAISYVAETGVHGRFLYLSPQVQTILGYRPDDCLSDPHFWWDHLNPEDHPIAMQEDTWEEGRPFQVEYRMRRQDGGEVWVRDEAVVVRDHGTGRRLTRGMLIDITERKHADDALRRSEESYRMFVAQSSEGIYCTEYDPPIATDLPVDQQVALGLATGYIAECNDAMARMYGLSHADDLTGKRLSDLLAAEHSMKEFMATFIKSGYRVADWESHERDAQGGSRIFRHTVTGIVSDGRLVRSWGIQRDVTARVHLEEQLRNAQQLEAIGRLAGGVAHDFNNILSIIMGHGELLRSSVGQDDLARNGLEQIRRAAERAASLTQQLLAFSRKQVLQPKVLDLNESVAEVQKMLSRVIGEDIELVASLQPSLASVKADPGQVEQVLMNLAVNARDAMPQGGKLTMETSNVELTADQARELQLPPGLYVRLRVIDSGHGMDSETLTHIFEPFFTTKATGKGTGLGLATVYGIVKQSGGSIQVLSHAGSGTEFSVFLPAAADLVRKPSDRAGTEVIGGGTETILIVEDEPDLRELTRVFLEAYGYRVLLSSGADEAIRMAEDSPQPIDLLLTDVIMPGMSGRQLAEKILSRRPGTKIMYMTGYTDDMVVQHKVLEPGVQLLQKPFSKRDLALKVRTTLDGK